MPIKYHNTQYPEKVLSYLIFILEQNQLDLEIQNQIRQITLNEIKVYFAPSYFTVANSIAF